MRGHAFDSRGLYRALLSKDRRFDGTIFFGVRTTGIYCRPICPARTPLFRNVLYYRSAAAAEAAGFRPCRRCRPEASPGTPAWIGTSTVVTRALRLIARGEPLARVAPSLGVSDRHLRRLFRAHLGASPQSIALFRRLDFARRLLDETGLPVTEIAFASGFESVRRFNDAFRRRFGRAPSAMRGSQGRATADSSLTLTLPYRPPFAFSDLLGFLRERAIPGVEHADERVYRRSFSAEGRKGILEVQDDAQRASLRLMVRGVAGTELLAIVGRVRALFDLDADPLAIASRLGSDKSLAGLVAARPGLRVPGCWDGLELAVRAVLGQQISVRGARTLAGRIAERWGPLLGSEAASGLSRVFPDATRLAEADLLSVGVTATRARAIRSLASAVASGRLTLSPGADPVDTRRTLLAIPGVGVWTAETIAMRALRDPNAFPATDLVLKRELGARPERTKRWEPWRAYAAVHLWRRAALEKETT